MNSMLNIAKNVMSISESELLALVIGKTDESNAQFANFIREAVIDSLNYDLGLAPNDFKLHFVPNSELLDVLKNQVKKEKLDLVTYVREAVIAVNDRMVAEEFLQNLSIRPSRYNSIGNISLADLPGLTIEREYLLKEKAVTY